MKWFLILHNLQHRRMNHGQPWDFAFPFLLKLKRCARNRYNLVILSLFSEIFGHFYVQKHLEPHHKILVFLAFRIMRPCFESQVSLFNSLIMQSGFFWFHIQQGNICLILTPKSLKTWSIEASEHHFNKNVTFCRLGIASPSVLSHATTFGWLSSSLFSSHLENLNLLS